MMRFRIFRTIGRAGLLSMIMLGGIFGVTQPAVQAQQSQTSIATAADTSQIYRVQFVEQDDTLNVRSGPGVAYPVLTTLANGSEVQVTGTAKAVGTSLWLPIQTLNDPAVRGWANRRYLARQIDPAVFCADEAVMALVETVREAVRTQDGDLLAETILPSRGLYLGSLYWGDNVRLSEDEVQNLFSDATIRDWGANMNSGQVIEGSIDDLMLPLMVSDLLPENVSIACYDSQDGLMEKGVYHAGIGLDALPFYSVKRPGTPGTELDWGAWALGIDDWEGTPVLAYLSHYYWTP
jgi:hypothetical protein